jgi:hypothetical protein
VIFSGYSLVQVYCFGASFAYSSTSRNSSGNDADTTTENNDDNASSAAATVVNANLRMIMLNGSGAHTHVITNFRLSNILSDENGTMTYIGNSTIGMPEAPIVVVPTTNKTSGEIISIFPEPSNVNDHLGSTPIYGVIEHGSEKNRRGPPPLPGPPMP